MTLWPISDVATVDIMAQFYEAAHKSGDAPIALDSVQRDSLVNLRKTNGLAKAVNLTGPFIMSPRRAVSDDCVAALPVKCNGVALR
jgi:hypothetical protein